MTFLYNLLYQRLSLILGEACYAEIFVGWHILFVIRYWDLEMSRRDVVLTRGTILNGFLVRCVEPGPGEFWFTN